MTDLQATANDWLEGHGSPIVFDIKSALNAQELTRIVDALGPPILSNALGFATGAATLLVFSVFLSGQGESWRKSMAQIVRRSRIAKMGLSAPCG